MSREWSYSGRIDRKCQHFWECPPPLRPKRAAQTAAQDFAPADTPKKQQIKRKRDTSNEVRKGTFLKRFDTRRVSTILRQVLMEFSEFCHVSGTGLLIQTSLGRAGGLGQL